MLIRNASQQRGGIQGILGSSLLGMWDASRVDKITMSAGSVSSWRDVVGDYDLTQGVSGFRPRWDANAFGGVLNLIPNSANLLASSWSSQGAAVLTDIGANGPYRRIAVEGQGATWHRVGLLTSVQVASGVQYEVTCLFEPGSSGKVRVEMRDSVGMVGSVVTVVIGGAFFINNTNAGPIANVAVSQTPAGYYRLTFLWTPNFTGSTASSGIGPNSDVAGETVIALGMQLAPQLSNGRFVITTGAAAYGFGRPGVIFDGADDELTLNTVPFPVGAEPCEMWALVDQQAPASDAGDRAVFAYGGALTAEARAIRRRVAGGVNRASGLTNSTALNNLSVDFSGRHVVRHMIGSAETSIQVDGLGVAPVAVVPGTTAARVRLGAITAATPSLFHQGQIAAALVTAPLNNVQAAQLLAYLKSIGGIA